MATKKKQKRPAVWVDFEAFSVATTRPQALCNAIAKAIRKHAAHVDWEFHYEIGDEVSEDILNESPTV